MIEEECKKEEYPFFSFEAGNTKLDLYIEKDQDTLPYGCISIREKTDVWSKPIRVNICEWAKYFVHKMGYLENFKSKDVSFSIGSEKEENNHIEFNGPFGLLKIDNQGNIQCIFNH